VSHASVHEAVGGLEFFTDLVERFYRGVTSDLLLRPLYPDDLAGSKRHLALFLQQYWGGPATYSQERGHPRLRMRHAPFVVGEAERDAWLTHMSAALDSLVAEGRVGPPAEDELRAYFAATADVLVNAR
jgi:hemoglobin